MKPVPDLSQDFSRQVENLVQKGYPQIAGMSTKRFRRLLEPLRDHIRFLKAPQANPAKGRLAFVVVVKSEWVASETAMSLVDYRGKSGSTRMYPHRTEDFDTIESVSIPNGCAYLLADIERGEKYVKLAPQEALKRIRARRRSPLTIDEGIAMVTQYPEFLAKNKCFSLLASRCAGDRRVPAIWINHEKQAHLGWCWDGNPHTWLGSASCGSRVGA